MQVKDQRSELRIDKCPNCKQHSLAISNMLVTIHTQCIRCGYATYKNYEGLDDNDKAVIIKMDAKSPIGCATLKWHNTTEKSIISIPEQDMYEAFLIYLEDHKDSIEYCTLSTFKDNIFNEIDLMILL